MESHGLISIIFKLPSFHFLRVNFEGLFGKVLGT